MQDYSFLIGYDPDKVIPLYVIDPIPHMGTFTSDFALPGIITIKKFFDSYFDYKENTTLFHMRLDSVGEKGELAPIYVMDGKINTLNGSLPVRRDNAMLEITKGSKPPDRIKKDPIGQVNFIFENEALLVDGKRFNKGPQTLSLEKGWYLIKFADTYQVLDVSGLGELYVFLSENDILHEYMLPSKK